MGVGLLSSAHIGRLIWNVKPYLLLSIYRDLNHLKSFPVLIL